MALKFNPLKTKTVKNDGRYVFGDFSHGLYLLDTPRTINEQLASLALVGGRNVWAEKGALVPQFGYMPMAQLPENEIVAGITRDSYSSSSFFLVTYDRNVYLYTSSQGLKRYKTKLPTVDNPIMAHRGTDLIINTEGNTFIFGTYDDSITNEITDENVPVHDYSTYYTFAVPVTSNIYYWNGKKISVDDTHQMNIVSTNIDESGENVIIRATFVGDPNDRPTLTGTVTLGEKTIKPVTLTYKAESGDYGNKILEPELMAIASNRLFVVDATGRIYYSAIGVIDNFEQANGAGFFEGFYSDSSKTLSIEDYMDGVLICKENGIYYLSLSNDTINIKKIANIGQETANDHVIVRESVYAYDSNSGSIVNAASVNVFGSIVAGNTVVDAIYLDSQGRGISSSPRWLTYNSLENVMILYYGADYTRGMVLNLNSNLYPRELDIPVKFFIGFNQGVMGVTEEGMIFQDFKNGTIIENLPAYAEFEAIGLRDNRMICSSILEVTELNGIDYKVTTSNAGGSIQSVQPIIGLGTENSYYPELIYSDYGKKFINNSFELETRWADKKASLTRLYAPMSGRNGVTIGIEFPKRVAFCLAALRLPDFSQGE